MVAKARIADAARFDHVVALNGFLGVLIGSPGLTVRNQHTGSNNRPLHSVCSNKPHLCYACDAT